MSSFFSSSSRTTRTVAYGPGGKTVTETTVTGGPGGNKTETKTYTVGGDSDVNGQFGGMNISIGQDGGEGRFVKVHRPTEQSRYTKGWGSRLVGGARYEKQAGAPMHVGTKTFQELRDQCLKEGRLFEDADFEAEDASIFFSRKPPRPFEWKRPTELTDAPKLFIDGASRFDVKQGELGNCWFLAAVASICQYQDLLFQIVPQDQGFEKGQYAGIFHFRFWQYGEWVDVIIDDRLPTYYDKLVFMHSVDKNEFWTPLIEKAYAKLHGSYEALRGGATTEAMEDFTGGVSEIFDFRQGVPPNLFHIMQKAYTKNSLMGCSIEAQPGKLEAELPNGLIMGHAYSITRVALVEIKTSRMQGKIPMVRIRNPWGNECEWKGAWSDNSQEWKFISAEERKELGLTFDNDGEFWMSFQDFTSNFQKLEVCHLGPDTMASDAVSKVRWEANNEVGTWTRRVNAGGCRNYLDTFWTNPQYRIQVVDADDDDEENMGTLIVALMQKGRRQKRKEGQDMLTMGYAIYSLKDPSGGPLDVRFFKYNASCAKSPSFINLREVTGRHKLPPGHYCIIPSTFEPNQEGSFVLRMFSEKPNKSSEMDEETGISDAQPVHEVTENDKKQEEEMRSAFKKIAGEDMEIDAYELQDILNAAFMKAKEFKFDGFSAETCRSLVAMMDMDRSGKLGFDEFKTLWNDLRLWKGVFKQYDKDKSGNFNSYEFRQVLHAIGFRVSNSTFNGLVMRYSRRDGTIHFDDYIHCIARLKTMFEVYKEMSKGSKAEFTMDEFIQTTMYS